MELSVRNALPKYDVDIVLNLSGPEGNAFAVMGAVANVLKQIDRSEVKLYQNEAMSGDYNNLLKISNEYVNLIDTSNSYLEILGHSEYGER